MKIETKQYLVIDNNLLQLSFDCKLIHSSQHSATISLQLLNVRLLDIMRTVKSQTCTEYLREYILHRLFLTVLHSIKDCLFLVLPSKTFFFFYLHMYIPV